MATVFNRLNLFLKNLYLDYYEVFKDLRRAAKNKPLRASLYGATTLSVLNLFRTNEGLRSYNSEVVSACSRMASVTKSQRNPISLEFVRNVGELNCHDQLRQVDLGFSTLIYKSDSNSDVALYRYNCPYLRPTIKQFFTERLVDFGVLGRWIRLELKMQDYDINPSEYENLSHNVIMEKG